LPHAIMSQVVLANNATLAGDDLSGAHLDQAHFEHTNLTGANLTGAHLTQANLSHVNLANNATLAGDDLSGAHLDHAHLEHANLTGADLTGANLTAANLTGANLTGANLTAANLTAANLTAANLTGADLTDAILNGADLTRATISDATFTETTSLTQWLPLSKFGLSGAPGGRFNGPRGVAVSQHGQIIVADSNNHRVQVFTQKSSRWIFQFGSFGAGEGEFNGPCGVAVNQHDQIIVSDSNNHRVQVWEPVPPAPGAPAGPPTAWRYLCQFGSQEQNSHFNGPRGVAVNQHDQIIVADFNHRVKVWEPVPPVLGAPAGPPIAWQYLCQFGSFGSGHGEFNGPCGVAVNQHDQIIVSDSNNHRVQVWEPVPPAPGAPAGPPTAWRHLVSLGPKRGSREGHFKRPCGVTVNRHDQIVVADSNNYRVQVWTPVAPAPPAKPANWHYHAAFGDVRDFSSPSGIAMVNATNMIVVVDHGADRVQVIRMPSE